MRPWYQSISPHAPLAPPAPPASPPRAPFASVPAAAFLITPTPLAHSTVSAPLSCLVVAFFLPSFVLASLDLLSFALKSPSSSLTFLLSLALPCSCSHACPLRLFTSRQELQGDLSGLLPHGKLWWRAHLVQQLLQPRSF